MTVRAVENDIETAVKAVIEAQLVTDGISGVTVDGLTLGAPGVEPKKPYVFIACRPLEHKGGQTDQWMGELQVDIHTLHLNTRDRDAADLVNIMASVAYAMDYGDFSAQTTRLNALQLRRTGGEYTFDESMNQCTIDVSVVKACGSK